MGAHTSRRTAGVPALVCRSAMTTTAAFALLGGGSGMALATEHPEPSEAADSCRIAIVDSGVEEFDGTVNHVTDGASAPFLEAGGQAIEPIHAAVCGPISDVAGDNPYNTLRGEAGPGDSADDPVQNTDDA